MKKLLVSIGLFLGPAFVFGQVYHAGEKTYDKSFANAWEISVGWSHSNVEVMDKVDERMLRNENGFTARGLYYPLRWLGIGVDGTWYNKKHFYGYTYQDKNYAVVGKFILTPETMPRTYALLGVGQRTQKLSYPLGANHRKNTGYALVALGVELEIYEGWFVGAEGQMMYSSSKDIDKRFHIKKCHEGVINLRTGIRF